LPEAKRRTGSHTFNQKKNTYGRVVTWLEDTRIIIMSPLLNKRL
jgi:hypothetical protein